MWPFRRKKKKKEEEDEEVEEQPKKKKRKRRKKKKPPKPWGRRERIIVASLLLGTVIFSAALALKARKWKLPGFPRLTVSKIEFPFFGEEKIVIEGNTEDTRSAEKATSEFRKKTDELTGLYGLYVVRLESGSSYGVEEDTTFQAASLIKLPVMASLYMEAESGKLDLDDMYVLKEEDKKGGSGSLANEEAGFTLTYRELIERMGQQSDNTAYSISLDILGEEKIVKLIDTLGMRNTNLEENETTPQDIGRFLRKLWNGEIINEKDRDEMLSYLTDTIYEDYIPSGLPDDVKVAHKYGAEVNVINDAGIVFVEKPYVVVILSEGIMKKEADEVIPELSGLIYRIEKDN